MRFENLIIGNTLEALIFSYINGYPIVGVLQPPDDMDYLPFNLSLKMFGYGELVINKLSYPKNKYKTKGIKKLDLWNILHFLLKCNGLSYSSYRISTMYHDLDKLTCTYDDSSKEEMIAEQYHVFSDKGVIGLEPIEHENIDYRVIDEFEIDNDNINFEYDFIEANSTSFCKEIFFIKPNILKSISYLSTKELEEQDNDGYLIYSDFESKWKTLHYFSKYSSSGDDISLTFLRRTLFPLTIRKHNDTDSMCFYYDTAETLIRNHYSRDPVLKKELLKCHYPKI